MACELVNPVFLKYHDALKGFIQKRVMNQSASHDILQEVLLKIYAHCKKLPEVKNVKAWVFEITRNSVYDYFNAKNKSVSLDIDLKEEEEDLNKEGLEYIRPMVELLPEEYAIPLVMSDLDNIPQKEIADRLQLSLSATKSRIQRGRVKLRDLFYECCRIEIDHQGNLVSCEIKEGCSSLQQIKKNLQNQSCPPN
jgi:RNA polymerase sigma-70 factor, ECF subfamily